MTEPRSRPGDGTRLAIVEERLKEVLDTVKGIDQALRFPENSPLGRQLIERADRNAKNIEALRTDVDVLEGKLTEINGVVKALRIVALLLGILVSAYTLIQIVNPSG